MAKSRTIIIFIYRSPVERCRQCRGHSPCSTIPG